MHGLAQPTQRGFTLLELLIVVAVIALSAGLVVLAVPSGGTRALELEAVKIAAGIEAARAQSRASGLVVLAQVVGEPGAQRLVFDPPLATLPALDISPDVRVEAANKLVLGNLTAKPDAKAIQLGPEPLIEPSAFVLSASGQSLRLETDGLRPFAVRFSEPDNRKP